MAGVVRFASALLKLAGILSVFVVPKLQGSEEPVCTRCEAAISGDRTGWIGCIFPEDMPIANTSLNIFHRPLGSDIPITKLGSNSSVMSCNWDSKTNQHLCIPSEGYEHYGSRGDKTVIIPNVGLEEEGSYACLVVGSKEQPLPCVLQYDGRPGPPQNVRVVRVTSDSLLLKWSPALHGVSRKLHTTYEQYYRIRFRKTTENDDDPVPRVKLYEYIDVPTLEATSYTLTGLDPSTEYEVGVLAFNIAGSSSFSREQKIRTKDSGVSPGTTGESKGSQCETDIFAALIVVVLLLVSAIVIIVVLVLKFCIKPKCTSDGDTHADPRNDDEQDCSQEQVPLKRGNPAGDVAQGCVEQGNGQGEDGNTATVLLHDDGEEGNPEQVPLNSVSGNPQGGQGGEPEAAGMMQGHNN